MKLSITHETQYDYQGTVDIAQHQACMRPADTPVQQCISHNMHIEPEPDAISTRMDAYGNAITWFSLARPHTRLLVACNSVVDTQPPLQVYSGLPWEAAQQHFVYHSRTRYDAAHQYLFPTHYANGDAAAAQYAASSFQPGRPLADVAIELMQRIYQEFTYQSGSTGTGTLATEVLARKTGVCQDFAHVLLSCLRAYGLPARYVSGYLLTQPPSGQPRLRGADASHAWASVYIPDMCMDDGSPMPQGGWLDLDPTNHRWGWHTPGEDYVRVAVGRDFADVSPLRGVLQGNGLHTLKVAVTVEPTDEAPTPPVLAANAG